MRVVAGSWTHQTTRKRCLRRPRVDYEKSRSLRYNSLAEVLAALSAPAGATALPASATRRASWRGGTPEFRTGRDTKAGNQNGSRGRSIQPCPMQPTKPSEEEPPDNAEQDDRRPPANTFTEPHTEVCEVICHRTLHPLKPQVPLRTCIPTASVHPDDEK